MFRPIRGLPTAPGPFCFSCLGGMPPPQNKEATMLEVRLDETDRIDWALKTFKRKVQKSGILRELRRRRHHVKPSEARQIKAKAARRRKTSR
jgi:small subunit ribosomal protein S21